MVLDVLPEHLGIVQSILRKHLPGETKTWAFGSRVRHTARPGSDLDLAVDAGRALTLTELADLHGDFDECDIPYKIDVVDMHATTPEFKKIIEAEKTPLPAA